MAGIRVQNILVAVLAIFVVGHHGRCHSKFNLFGS